MPAKGRVAVLIRKLRSKDPAVRREAARMLGIMGPAAKDAVPDLKKAKEDEDPTVRRLAELALNRIDEATGTKRTGQPPI